MSSTELEQAIFDHLRLAERNRKLEPTMPIDRYRELYDRGGGSARPASRDEFPTSTQTLDPSRDFGWDASSERALPLFDWSEG